MQFNDYLELFSETEFPVRSRVKLSKEDTNYIEIIAPGHKKDDFSLSVDFEKITVSLKNGSYKEKFHLKNGFDKESIEATCDAGILTISVPYKESSKPREIPIN